MSYAIIGLLFVLVLVFAILASKTWHWVNIVFLILTFITGAAASVGLSQSLDLRRKAMQNAKRYEDLAIRNTQLANEEISGPANSDAYSADSLRGRTEALEREQYGRGRVWSSGTVTPNAENRTFKFAAARGDENQQIKMEGMIVYAFADIATDDNVIHPVAYVGTFRIISETPEQAELEPIFIAGESLNGNITGTWSLFEKMPVDRRDAFKKAYNVTDENFDITSYRAIVTNGFPADAMGFDLSDQDDAKAYELLIDRYTFDGLTLGQIANWIEKEVQEGRTRLNTVFDAVREETFIEYQFDKKTDAVFEVDATANLRDDGYFTQQGLAAAPSLHAGKKIAFAEGDKVLIDQLSAEGYQRAPGNQVPPFTQQYPDVSEVDRYFFRQLKDYPFILSNLDRQTEKLGSETVRVAAGNKITEKAEADAQAQIDERNDIVSKLSADQENFKNDRDVIAALLALRTKELNEVEAQVRMLRGELTNLYSEIHGKTTSTKSSKRHVAGR